MKVTGWKAVASGKLLGFADVEHPSGLILHQCGVFSSGDRTWVSPPCKRATDRQGQPVTNRDGKPVYENFASFKNKATATKWSDAVIDALQRDFPQALAG